MAVAGDWPNTVCARQQGQLLLCKHSFPSAFATWRAEHRSGSVGVSGTHCNKTKPKTGIRNLPPPHLVSYQFACLHREESVLNFFSFFPLSHPHFFSDSTLQVKVSEPQNSIDVNTENEHLKSIKMCLNQSTEWNLSFSAASLASCKVFNQNLKTDENK